jgi:DNA-binding LytR/AlgR family response regulator
LFFKKKNDIATKITIDFMKYACIIVDDEPLAAKLIAKHIASVSSLELIASCHDAIEAYEYIHKHRIDLMFLDIQMPRLSGIDFLYSLKNPPAVILTTAYKEYAIDAFELDVLDYLLKPISFDRFLKAIDKYIQLKSKEEMEVSQKPMPVLQSREEFFLFVKSDKKHHKISIFEIFYIEAYGEYIKIKLKNDETILSKDSMNGILEKLPQDKFFRCHKSYIVNFEHIHSFTTYAIDISGKSIPIGRSYKKEVMARLSN